MKKLVMTAAVLACAASVVTAQTVTSANMVGYTKVQAIGGQLTLVSLNFAEQDVPVVNLIGDQLPSGSVLFVWDKTTQAYTGYTKAARGGWPVGSSISSGEAFWIQASGAATNQVILAGEVLLAATNTVALPLGLTATGYYYPVETLWTDTDLSVQLPSGSVLFKWDGSQYDGYTKAARGGWSTATGVTVGPNEGFWVSTPSAINWSEVRPFNVD